MADPTEQASPRTYARIAGCAYLLIMMVAAFGVALVDSSLIVSGDDSATAHNIVANGLLFRLGIVSVLVIYASVVVLSWALYVLLKEVNRRLALLALLLRLAEAVIGATTVLLSFVVLFLLDGQGSSPAFDAETRQRSQR